MPGARPGAAGALTRLRAMAISKILLFYRFTPLADPEAVRCWQQELCLRLGLRGRIIVSPHGINATVGGDIDACKAYLKATKGYPPSVFAKLPALVERAGNGISGGGSITAFYTVLTEGDDQQDPIADSARAILDGHIVLSRRLAEAGHYPAIDIEASISRAMTALITEQHYARVRNFKQLLSSFQRNRDLVSVGAYAKGSDPMLDKAITLWPQLEAFLQQGIFERADWEDSIQALELIFPQV